MSFLDVYDTRIGGRVACAYHAASSAEAQCAICKRFLCPVCTFKMGSAVYCPDCVNHPPVPIERRLVLKQGLLAMVAAGAAAVLTYAAGLAGGGLIVELLELLPALGCALVGASLALIARERARRTGSLLPAAGIAVNAALICYQAVEIARAMLYG